LVIDTPHTFALVDASGRPATSYDGVTLRPDSNYGVLAASSLGREPIASSKRLLVTFLGRVEPTDLRWADDQRRVPGDPGIPPLRREPGRAVLTWKRSGMMRAYKLKPTGERAIQAPVEKTSEGWKLVLDGDKETVHWEVVVD
jgi:hypothetical protein